MVQSTPARYSQACEDWEIILVKGSAGGSVPPGYTSLPSANEQIIVDDLSNSNVAELLQQRSGSPPAVNRCARVFSAAGTAAPTPTPLPGPTPRVLDFSAVAEPPIPGVWNTWAKAWGPSVSLDAVDQDGNLAPFSFQVPRILRSENSKLIPPGLGTPLPSSQGNWAAHWALIRYEYHGSSTLYLRYWPVSYRVPSPPEASEVPDNWDNLFLLPELTPTPAGVQPTPTFGPTSTPLFRKPVKSDLMPGFWDNPNLTNPEFPPITWNVPFSGFLSARRSVSGTPGIYELEFEVPHYFIGKIAVQLGVRNPHYLPSYIPINDPEHDPLTDIRSLPYFYSNVAYLSMGAVEDFGTPGMIGGQFQLAAAPPGEPTFTPIPLSLPTVSHGLPAGFNVTLTPVLPPTSVPTPTLWHTVVAGVDLNTAVADPPLPFYCPTTVPSSTRVWRQIDCVNTPVPTPTPLPLIPGSPVPPLITLSSQPVLASSFSMTPIPGTTPTEYQRQADVTVTGGRGGSQLVEYFFFTHTGLYPNPSDQEWKRAYTDTNGVLSFMDPRPSSPLLHQIGVEMDPLVWYGVLVRIPPSAGEVQGDASLGTLWYSRHHPDNRVPSTVIPYTPNPVTVIPWP